jgi:hypothetical protein
VVMSQHKPARIPRLREWLGDWAVTRSLDG